MAGFRYDPKGCFSHVHGAYEQELPPQLPMALAQPLRGAEEDREGE